MKVETRREGLTVIVSPSGRLDGVGAPVLEAALSEIASGGGSAVLDGREIGYISSAGIRALLVGAKAFAQEGGELSVAALRPECRTVIELSGLLSVLRYHETVQATPAPEARGRRERERRSDLKIEVWREGRATVLALNGRLDYRGSPKLLTEISAAVERGSGRVVLDCPGMSYISSVGLRVLLIGAKVCQQEGAKLAIAALSPNCRSVVEMSGFLSVIDYYETRDAALEAPV